MMRWLVVLILFGAVIFGALTERSPREPNICSLEYRAAYLEMHDSDAVLRRECPYEPWYRN